MTGVGCDIDRIVPRLHQPSELSKPASTYVCRHSLRTAYNGRGEDWVRSQGILVRVSIVEGLNRSGSFTEKKSTATSHQKELDAYQI
jgi:hypothetical protein